MCHGCESPIGAIDKSSGIVRNGRQGAIPGSAPSSPGAESGRTLTLRISTSLRAAILIFSVLTPVGVLTNSQPVYAASTGIVTTIAGTGNNGYTGNGGPAPAADLSFPTDAAEAFNGDILVADEGNNVIRQIAPDGTISTVAGVPGPGGFAGDSGPATSARLNQPSGVSPTADGGFLIADRGNNRVRRVSSAGVITTVAGSGKPCSPSGGACGDGGSATAATLSSPYQAIPTPDGGFLIAEGNRIRKVSAAGVISRAAGTGLACSNPVSPCGDHGPGTAAQLNKPTDAAVMSDGSILIADSGDNRVRAVPPSGVITTIAGNGVAGSWGNGITATSANLNSPSGVAVAPNGSIVIADSYSHLIRTVTGGVIRTLGGTADTSCTVPSSPCGDGGPATNATFNVPFELSVTPDGEVLAADLLDHRIRRIDAGLGSEPTIHVQGRLLENGAGRPVQLRGVNRAAFESRCTWDTSGVADGPTDQASINAMLAWKINVVRLPLNEDCWLGINGLPLDGNAAGYRTAVQAYVNLLRKNGLYAIPVAQMSAPGSIRSTEIDYMPDAGHMPAFWTSVATTFKTDHGVIFDPVNEAAMASWNNPAPNPPGQWNCWLHGCTLNSVYAGAPRYTAAGLQSLVDAIRATGATQPILLGGLDYNADLTQLLSYLPTDPQHQLIASTHVYDFVQGSGVDATFTSQLEPIAAKMPVILGELGEQYCDSGTASFTKHVLSLIDGEAAKGNLIGVLEWTWNAGGGWQCPTGQYGDGGPLLIRDYSGTPTVMGGAFKAWMASKTS
jgi:Cellulase (glycosyl hydrolase family 5)/NHL repeat